MSVLAPAIDTFSGDIVAMSADIDTRSGKLDAMSLDMEIRCGNRDAMSVDLVSRGGNRAAMSVDLESRGGNRESIPAAIDTIGGYAYQCEPPLRQWQSTSFPFHLTSPQCRLTLCPATANSIEGGRHCTDATWKCVEGD